MKFSVFAFDLCMYCPVTMTWTMRLALGAKLPNSSSQKLAAGASGKLASGATASCQNKADADLAPMGGNRWGQTLSLL